MTGDWGTAEDRAKLAAELLTPISDEEFSRRVSDKRFSFYTSYAMRMGFGALASMVEYRLFHPNVGPNSNDDFLYMTVAMEDMPFTVFGVPERFEPQVQEFADAILMRIVKDALPAMIGPNGLTKFPGTDEVMKGRQNLYSVENTTGSLVYLNKPGVENKIRDHEREIIDVLMMYGDQVPLDLIRRHLWLENAEGQA